MFYIDAVMLANPTGTWEISDYWPDILVGTLAHEFQHMIHFYQKAVLRNAQSDTWLDEMCSLTTEDFVANRLGFSSPAAIRLPTFVSKNYEMGVTEWDSSSSNSYSEAYCFGSYLLRNYGGTELFKNIQHSSYGDYRAVQEATGVDFGSLIRRWGAALVLSDKSTLSSDLIADKIVMNKPADFIEANTTYSYDSINLYSYNGTHNFYLSRGDLLSLYTQKAASNIIIKAGSSMSGTSVWKFRMTNPVKVTAVVK